MGSCLLENSEPFSPGDVNNSDGDLIIYEGDIITSTSGARYCVESFLGGGAFGKVYKATRRSDGFKVAIKISSIVSASRLQATNEISLLQFFTNNSTDESQYIYKIVDSFDHIDHTFIITPLYFSNLLNVLDFRGYKGLPCNLVQRLLRQISLAIKFLHNNRIIHTDLKPENIMLTECGDVRIIDFGASKVNIESGYTSYLQTIYYRAPEVILALPLSDKIDIWSLGCIAAEAFLGMPIFAGETDNEVLQLMERRLGRFPEEMIERSNIAELFFDDEGKVLTTNTEISQYVYLHDDIDGMILDSHSYVPAEDSNLIRLEHEVHQELLDLIKGMLRYDPESRFSIEDVLNHPFITQSITQSF